MRTLVISDIHNRIDWIDECLDKEKWDKVVFLGDYFDNFHDDERAAIKTAKFLVRLIQHKVKYDLSIKLLLGNHDLYYMFTHHWEYIAAGFTPEKNRAVRSILNEEHWKHFDVACESQGFLLSHAGASPYHFARIDGELTTKNILKRCDHAKKNLTDGNIDSILLPGRDRCGKSAYHLLGGITWLHWGSFTPIDSVNQIVGHSISREVRRAVNALSRNYCIDTDSKHLCVIEDGVLEIKENIYLK